MHNDDEVSAPGHEVRVQQAPDQLIRGYRSRMYSPLCGLVVAVGCSTHGRRGPRVSVAGGELTGVHVLQDQNAPRPGSYHIGGSGVVPFESEIKTFGESAERYAGSIAALDPDLEEIFASHDKMRADGYDVLDASKLYLTDPAAPHSGAYPFQTFDPTAPMTWVQAENLGQGSGCRWIPAQQFLVGYPVRAHDGEPWLAAAVSTGTAVHTDYDRALLAAVFELVQIDSAMGHWYGQRRSIRLDLDDRVARLCRLLDKHMPPGGYVPEFHLLPNADLPGFTIACLLHEPQQRVPVVSAGLGADATLEGAMYKAWLEGVGVRSLAEWSLVNTHLESGTTEGDVDAMLDLDSNVVHAAQPAGAAAVHERFRDCDRQPTSALPPDSRLDAGAEARRMIWAFRDTDKELYARDLTTTDVRSLGFRAMRLWSPDTLSLCLPSAPPQQHRRFDAYGGFARRIPHPYP